LLDSQERLFVWLFRLFPNLKVLTARHQLREFINLPPATSQLKTLHLCLTDQLDGKLSKKLIYRATCAACEAMAPDDDEDIGFSLFD
jgi:hypothetical protein